MSTWKDFKQKDVNILTPDELVEIDLQVKIVGEILKARQNKEITQRAFE